MCFGWTLNILEWIVKLMKSHALRELFTSFWRASFRDERVETFLNPIRIHFWRILPDISRKLRYPKHKPHKTVIITSTSELDCENNWNHCSCQKRWGEVNLSIQRYKIRYTCLRLHFLIILPSWRVSTPVQRYLFKKLWVMSTYATAPAKWEGNTFPVKQTVVDQQIYIFVWIRTIFFNHIY